MPQFTPGKWILTPQYYHDKPMLGIYAVDGTDLTPVALVEHEDEAKLLVHTPTMFGMLNEICIIYDKKAQCKLEDNTRSFMSALMSEEKAVSRIKQLLARIDAPELNPTFEYDREIKPCPFCGGEAHLLPAYNGSSQVWRVQCSRCMAESMRNSSPTTPIEYWNKRPRTF